MLGTLARASVKLVVAAVLFLGTLEVYLAVFPDTLPPRLGNYAFSKYGAFPGGMYFHDPVTEMNFLKPDFETEAYFNGYRWHHRADSLGFRNPPRLEEREVLLLGDSLIYGHGVEEVETTGHYLRSEHGIAAYNMARQGDCVYQSYVLLRLHARDLGPTDVVLFVFLNDFHDVTFYRDRRLIEARPEADWDYEAMRRRLAEIEGQQTLHPRLLLGLASTRLLRGIAQSPPTLGLVRSAEASTREQGPRPTRALPGATDPIDLPYLEALLDPSLFARVAAYYEATLRDLSRRSSDAGSRLTVVHLAIDDRVDERWRAATERLSAFLAGTCQRSEIRYFTTEGLFTGCDDCFLPGDGHLSPAGHRRLAAWLAARLGDSVAVASAPP
ncbi:MAG: hypothetical protein R3244_14145, partial [Thermoanaerobaculia bacterium]|nr:hypothetical protein [Thermoanaerobaculia bacterium]